MSKKIVAVFFFTAVTVLAGWLFSGLKFANGLDAVISDGLIRYVSPGQKTSDDIVLVLLDEETMKELPYRSPVPRDFLFQLNERILEAGPKAVGYDIFFKDPTLDAADQRLAGSFKKGPVFAVSVGRQDANGKWFEDGPLPLFKDSLKGLGIADLPFSSSDSTVRFAKLDFDLKGVIKRSFVAELYKEATGGDAEALLHDPKRELSIAGFRYHPYLNERSDTLSRIRYVGPPLRYGAEDGRFKAYPAGLVAKGLIPNGWLKDKIVLVGASYDDGTDAYITPYYSSRYNYERMPGVEIHANVLNSLLTRQFYYEVPPDKMLIGFAVLGLISSLLFLFGPIWRGAASLGLLTALLAAKVVLAFHYFGLVVPFVQFEGPMVLIFGASLGFRSVTEGKQKRFIKNVFAKYVPPAVVERMISDPRLLTLGGEQRDITCLFTDIASFTTISEKMDPRALVSFLNEYLDRLTRIIFKHGGTLDKYEGDAIIAFFGAPVDIPDHRAAGVMAAIEMRKASSEISEKWKDACGMEVVTRIGINSGPAVVGNMGSGLRFDYTAIGDTMNLASRLEGANKFFGTTVLAGESTVSGLRKGTFGDEPLFRPVARIKVKGKTEPVGVYEVAGLASEISKEDAVKIKDSQFPKDIIELTSK